MVLKWISPIHVAQKDKKELDYLGYIIIGITLFITLPQVATIYTNESAQDVSLITWIGYTFVGVWWLFYGLERNVHPMIVSSTLHIIVDIIVVYGIIKFEGFVLW